MTARVVGIYIEFNDSFTGGPRAMFRLAMEMRGTDFQPLVLTNRASALTEALANESIEAVVVPQPRVIGDDDGAALRGSLGTRLKALREIYRYNGRVQAVLKERGVELLLVRNVKGVLMAGLAARRLRIPLVWDIGMEKRSVGAMRLLHEVGFRLAKRVVTQGSHVAPSIFNASQLRRFGHKIEVIPNALPRERVEALRRDTPSEPRVADAFNVLNVATINPRKNQMMVLHAVAALHAKFPALRVQFVGPATDEAYERALHAFATHESIADRVAFLGWRDDVGALLHQAHLFTLTSREEGMPQSVLEAMHAHVPVLATAAGGVPDVVEHEQTGLLVPIDDQAAYTAALERCLSDPPALRAMAERAQQRVSTQFTVERWYRRYHQLFETLLAER